MSITAPILAIDTALASCGVAVRDASGRLSVDEAEIGIGHAEHLIPQIARVLAEAGVTPAELGRIVCVVGPGSFTGIRAGLAAARGLALALSIPVIPVTSLEALAAEARATQPGRAILAVLDARRDEVYAQVFSADGTAQTEPAVLSRAVAAALGRRHAAIAIGSGAALLDGVDSVAGRNQAGIVTVLAIGADRPAPARAPGPLYIRGADAKVPQNAAIARAAIEEARP